MRRTTAPCRHCDGTGHRPLPAHLQRTLDWLRVHGPATAAEVFAGLAMRGAKTAANNRLQDLILLGLVQRERRDEKTYVYSAVRRRNGRKP